MTDVRWILRTVPPFGVTPTKPSINNSINTINRVALSAEYG